jgi:hypothetical protein
MKRLLILSAALMLTQGASAQWILGFTVQPATPTSNDTVTVIASVSFPSGGCDDKTQYQSVAGSHIYAGALHCIGPLTFICNTTDTFKIPPLAAGNYTFVYQVDAGQGPSPCTPGFVPGPRDSVTFTVTSSSSIPENPSFGFGMYPLPANDIITLTFAARPDEDVVFEIIDIAGKIVVRENHLHDGMSIGLQKLPAGNYIARLMNKSATLTERKFSILR